MKQRDAKRGAAGKRRAILEAIDRGKPPPGPTTVHVDITNACNAACVTCWDHSPLLATPRPISWKRQALSLATFEALVEELARLESVESFILSGMGDPLVHPDVYAMIDLVKSRGFHLTLLSNLVAADIARLAGSGVDQLLVGVHGVTPPTYMAFHPGFTERHFNTLCRYLRRLGRAGTRMRHVQVINRDNAGEVVEMIRFGKTFGADRVNFKLASLAEGTEACAITKEQRHGLAEELIPEARHLAESLGVATNLDLFAAQIAAAEEPLTTTPMQDVGCFMGHVYTRITVAGDVLYCCNTNVRVGSLEAASFSELWHGPSWQALRERFRRGDYAPGCERCGKFEQNVKWSKRVRRELGESRWAEVTGQGRAGSNDGTPDAMLRDGRRRRLQVLS